MIRKICAVASATITEAIQQPLALLTMLTALAFTLLAPVFQFHRFGEDGRLARDSGLSCILIFGLALAATTAGRSVAAEIANGTAAAAISKPLSRTIFLIAKWLGVCSVVTLFWLALSSATMLAERGSAHFVEHPDFNGYVDDHLSLAISAATIALALLIAALASCYAKRRFGVTAFYGVVISQPVALALSQLSGWLRGSRIAQACCDGSADHIHHHTVNWLAWQPPLNTRIITAALLLLLALYIFAALATALATRLKTVPTLTLCAIILVLGLAGDSLTATLHSSLSIIHYPLSILPDMQHFWLSDALARGGSIPLSYLGRATLYAATCSTLFLTLGALMFRKRDLM